MIDNTSRTKTRWLALAALLAANSACSADELPVRNVGNTSNGLASPAGPGGLSGNARFAGRWLG